ncbi:MAG: hypothetical protein IVW57_17220 [Ktedonobacterales bacterium]|nr:hypothetical protein [Ktedonobacterales bacterium]
MTQRKKILIGVGVALLLALALGFTTQASAMSYGGAADALRAAGATVQDNGTGTSAFLRGADHRLTVNGESVDVFEYATTFSAGLDAGRIGADGTTISGGFGPFGGQAAIVDFIAPPHWFAQGRVIVLYVGRSTTLVALLTKVFGAQFAGQP